MRDTELYRHLLGVVAPWEVERVELSAQEARVDVWVVHPGRTRFACPDHYPQALTLNAPEQSCTPARHG